MALLSGALPSPAASYISLSVVSTVHCQGGKVLATKAVPWVGLSGADEAAPPFLALGGCR